MPFNYALARRAVMSNGATQAAITKIDVLFQECKGVKSYDELSKETKRFVEKVEKEISVRNANWYRTRRLGDCRQKE
ncbi:MAG: hypothetical protein ACETVM_02355 [Candidatus Bathyarchaeia archaeon]